MCAWRSCLASLPFHHCKPQVSTTTTVRPPPPTLVLPASPALSHVDSVHSPSSVSFAGCRLWFTLCCLPFLSLCVCMCVCMCVCVCVCVCALVLCAIRLLCRKLQVRVPRALQTCVAAALWTTLPSLCSRSIASPRRARILLVREVEGSRDREVEREGERAGRAHLFPLSHLSSPTNSPHPSPLPLPVCLPQRRHVHLTALSWTRTAMFRRRACSPVNDFRVPCSLSHHLLLQCVAAANTSEAHKQHKHPLPSLSSSLYFCDPHHGMPLVVSFRHSFTGPRSKRDCTVATPLPPKPINRPNTNDVPNPSVRVLGGGEV